LLGQHLLLVDGAGAAARTGAGLVAGRAGVDFRNQFRPKVKDKTLRTVSFCQIMFHLYLAHQIILNKKNVYSLQPIRCSCVFG
jgi:hypothetical protein